MKVTIGAGKVCSDGMKEGKKRSGMMMNARQLYKKGLLETCV